MTTHTKTDAGLTSASTAPVLETSSSFGPATLDSALRAKAEEVQGRLHALVVSASYRLARKALEKKSGGRRLLERMWKDTDKKTEAELRLEIQDAQTAIRVIEASPEYGRLALLRAFVRRLKRPLIVLPESMPSQITKEPVPAAQLPELKPLTSWPRVDIISVNYNGMRHIPGFLAAARKLDYPREQLHFFIVDNASYDGSADVLERESQDLPRSFIRVGHNSGFTGGNNIALRASQAKYVLLLNPDTVIAPDCLKILVMRAEQERGAGMIEPAMQPVEHPKMFDPKTQETSWCSGAGTLILRNALTRTGVFDETFFMYCEDVDLSWRMWSRGYRCVYEPRATFRHEQGLHQHKGGYRSYYLSFRNGLMMRFIYGGIGAYLAYARKMLRIIFFQDDHPFEAKKYLVRALLAHLRYAPHLIGRRLTQTQFPPAKQIRFYGWDYHLRRW
jgi:GT2 family glycosyltransferase